MEDRKEEWSTAAGDPEEPKTAKYLYGSALRLHGASILVNALGPKMENAPLGGFLFH